jgi:hypothetical protein
MTGRQLLACAAALAPTIVGLQAFTESPEISGPYSHGNLAVYLIHGPSDDDRDFLTLDEGLTAGGVIVREKPAPRRRQSTRSASSAARLSDTGTYNAIVENPTLQADRKQLIAALIGDVEKAKTATGMAVAINGQIVSADVYASASLFRKLSRKLLDSYATEAVLARKAETTATPPSKETAAAFLSSASDGASKVESVGGSMHQRTVEGSATVLYEYAYQGSTKDGKAPSAKLIHRSYLKKL